MPNIWTQMEGVTTSRYEQDEHTAPEEPKKSSATLVSSSTMMSYSHGAEHRSSLSHRRRLRHLPCVSIETQPLILPCLYMWYIFFADILQYGPSTFETKWTPHDRVHWHRYFVMYFFNMTHQQSRQSTIGENQDDCCIHFRFILKVSSRSSGMEGTGM